MSHTLIAEHLPQFAPCTNHYALEDGRYVIVTVPHIDTLVPKSPVLAAFPVAEHTPMPTEVFLCDENAVLIDANGDPLDGMTPLLRLPAGTSHADALAAIEAA